MDQQTHTLSDGRRLGYQSLGDPGGRPIFWFHGTPGSRLILSPDDWVTRLPGVRVITADRPGYGLSDPKPDRTLADWARDVAELADHLGVDRFAVAGESGGGPHALACAHQLGRRVTLALLLSSPAPANFRGATRGMSLGNRLGLVLQRRAPWLIQWMTRSYAAGFQKNPDRFLDAIARQMSAPDRELLRDRRLREALIRDFREAYRQGGEGHVVDGALAMSGRDWGFPLEEIAVPVFIWHGEADRLVSINMPRHLSHRIPDCRASFVPGAGHLLLEHPQVEREMGQILRGSISG